MKVLVIIPPHIPSYFNAAHHLCCFMVGAYIRSLNITDKVVCYDAGVLNIHWKEIGDLLFQGDFDLIALSLDFDTGDGVERFVRYAREISPQSKLIAFGRLVRQVPGFFQKLNFDAVAHDGDFEVSVSEYLKSLIARSSAAPGCLVRNEDGWIDGGPGRMLPAEEWALPDIREIPYEHYSQLYRSDQNKFAGIPERAELVVPVARGCPVNCNFCDVPIMQGRKERRLGVKETLDYIEDSLKVRAFDYVAMFAPTFTLQRRWVLNFCDEKRSRALDISWKCATTLFHLDQDLVREMAASGCRRISVGLESLSTDALMNLPKLKHSHPDQLWNVQHWCSAYGVELNCFVILGLPGESAEQARKGISLLIENGIRVRPTVYTPFWLLDQDMSSSQISEFNRQIFSDSAVRQSEKRVFYELLFEEASHSKQLF